MNRRERPLHDWGAVVAAMVDSFDEGSSVSGKGNRAEPRGVGAQGRVSIILCSSALNRKRPSPRSEQ
jgi:hypothetical protein